MAQCEQGYLCEVCGEEVEDITGSDLYLRYVLGEVDPEKLHIAPERHIRCNPTLAQFITAEGFEAVVIEGFFGKSNLDPEFVAIEEARVTQGYLRLRDVFGIEGLPLTDYPLPGVMDRWSVDNEAASDSDDDARLVDGHRQTHHLDLVAEEPGHDATTSCSDSPGIGSLRL
ncbi:MAG: hypothetical protein JWN86_1708 [Planctomycetota bacterium]|nr:hypothetical protein [Planctomycetota bacterium]